MGKKERKQNRLANEKSPYLLQHANNPVDWYPWGQEAFSAAKQEDKPIFLSIGYATCHWCHVMEKESFQDETIAQALNDTFINIKLDREEHPEVDSLYMEFAQGMIAGTAGWPLNVVLTCELEPIFAATYLPPSNRHGMMGLLDLANHFKQIWQGEEREKLKEQAEKMVEVFREGHNAENGKLPKKEEISQTAEIFFKIADPLYGGLKGAPKFPLAYQLSFLLRFAKIKQDSRAIYLVDKTLEMMRRGGIYDHLGGGFSRYSVDERWVVPHFEKMLYDNAIAANAYLEAWTTEKNEHYKTVTQETLNYVMRVMTSETGGYFSAEDADSEGAEGKFYTWTLEEMRGILNPEDVDLISLYYDVTPEGNFQGRSVLNTPDSFEEFCLKYALPEEVFRKKLEKAKKILFNEREKRIRPFKDDKIITSWNGLMIDIFCQAAVAFNEPIYLESATRAAHFILEKLWDGTTLLRRFREDHAKYHGILDDYAFFIKGLLSLFETTGEANYLQWALSLTDLLKEKFEREEGAFYLTDGSDENLIIKKAQFADGAEPSGNAVHAENLLRLYQITRQDGFLKGAEGVFKGVSNQLGTYSPGFAYHVTNLMRYYDAKAPTFILACGKQEKETSLILQKIYTTFLPHKAVVIIPKDREIEKILPYLASYVPLENKTTLYYCTQNHCKEPLNNVNKILDMIEKL